MSHRAVLFDLDGTLLDTLDDLADSMNASLEAMHLPAHPTAAYKIFVGDGVRNMALRALPEGRRDDGAVDRLVAAMRTRYAEHWADKTRPYEGIPDLLDELASRGLATAVLSNKPDDFTKLMVERLLPGRRFAAVLGARPGVPLKPDPAAAVEIARDLGVAVGEFLYVGDTGTDMCTAVAAGMFPVGVLWGFRGADELTENGAKVLLRCPQELLDVLTK